MGEHIGETDLTGFLLKARQGDRTSPRGWEGGEGGSEEFDEI